MLAAKGRLKPLHQNGQPHTTREIGYTGLLNFEILRCPEQAVEGRRGFGNRASPEKVLSTSSPREHQLGNSGGTETRLGVLHDVVSFEEQVEASILLADVHSRIGCNIQPVFEAPDPNYL